MIEVPIVLLCGVLVAWTLSLFFPPIGHRRFVWVLWSASLVPALFAYKWLTAPVFSWVTE
jgi:hypothetical protein